MNAVEAAAKAIAAFEGDPYELIEVSMPHGLTRVPAWRLYRARARVTLEAARDIICDQIDRDVECIPIDENECVCPTLDDFRLAYDRAIAP